MIRFDRSQLIAFLRAIDRNLAEPVSLLLVGGAAASIAYGARIRTADIDVLHSSSDNVLTAARRARQQTGLGVTVGAAPVAELPYRFRERVKKVRGVEFDRLTITVPDKYDLVLSKALRAYPHDMEAISEIHAGHKLSRRTLVRRFETELMNLATADPARIRLNMAMLVSRLYGFDEGRNLAERWGVPVPRVRR